MSNVRTIARPYAQAAFDYALSNSQLELWSDFLTKVAAIVANEKVVELIKNPQVNDSDVTKMLINICGDTQLDQHIQNFLHVVASYHRLLLLATIAEMFDELKLQHEKTLTAHIYSSEPIPEAQEIKLKQALEQRFKQTIILAQVLDKSLIGGALIRVGDTVIDGSVRGKLERLRNYLNLKERVCHQ